MNKRLLGYLNYWKSKGRNVEIVNNEAIKESLPNNQIKYYTLQPQEETTPENGDILTRGTFGSKRGFGINENPNYKELPKTIGVPKLNFNLNNNSNPVESNIKFPEKLKDRIKESNFPVLKGNALNIILKQNPQLNNPTNNNANSNVIFHNSKNKGKYYLHGDQDKDKLLLYNDSPVKNIKQTISNLDKDILGVYENDLTKYKLHLLKSYLSGIEDDDYVYNHNLAFGKTDRSSPYRSNWSTKTDYRNSDVVVLGKKDFYDKYYKNKNNYTFFNRGLDQLDVLYYDKNKKLNRKALVDYMIENGLEKYLQPIKEQGGVINPRDFSNRFNTKIPMIGLRFRNRNIITPQMKQGGRIPVEVERDELILNPQGNLSEVQGRLHSQGGEDRNLQQGSIVIPRKYASIFKKFHRQGDEMAMEHIVNMLPNSENVEIKNGKPVAETGYNPSIGFVLPEPIKKFNVSPINNTSLNNNNFEYDPRIGYDTSKFSKLENNNNISVPALSNNTKSSMGNSNLTSGIASGASKILDTIGEYVPSMIGTFNSAQTTQPPIKTHTPLLYVPSIAPYRNQLLAQARRNYADFRSFSDPTGNRQLQNAQNLQDNIQKAESEANRIQSEQIGKGLEEYNKYRGIAAEQESTANREFAQRSDLAKMEEAKSRAEFLTSFGQRLTDERLRKEQKIEDQKRRLDKLYSDLALANMYGDSDITEVIKKRIEEITAEQEQSNKSNLFNVFGSLRQK